MHTDCRYKVLVLFLLVLLLSLIFVINSFYFYVSTQASNLPPKNDVLARVLVLNVVSTLVSPHRIESAMEVWKLFVCVCGGNYFYATNV